jgi:hypothetical protein
VVSFLSHSHTLHRQALRETVTQEMTARATLAERAAALEARCAGQADALAVAATERAVAAQVKKQLQRRTRDGRARAPLKAAGRPHSRASATHRCLFVIHVH